MNQGSTKICPRCSREYDGAASFCQLDGAALQWAAASADPRIGQVLLEQFRIEERIGAGGMGVVYRARQTSVDRDVAIKILHPDLARDPDAVRRFEREARISTSLDHPHIVRVLLFGQLPDGSLYLVMELLVGETLGARLLGSPVPPLDRSLHIATQIGDAIGEAHSMGIVHRDIKPENIFLVSKGRDHDFVKVLDFGIARVLHDTESTLATQTGLVFGTARYISPEGAAGKPTDARSDVYSLGVLTYQMLAGRTPFDASSPMTMLMHHVHDEAPPLSLYARAVPSAIAQVVMRALQKEPAKRYSDGESFAEALRAAARTAGFEVRSGGSGLLERRDPSGPSIRYRERATGSSSSATPYREVESSSRSPDTSAPDTSELYVAGLPRPDGARPRRPLLTLIAAFVVGAVAVTGGAYAVQALRNPAPVSQLDTLQVQIAAARAAHRYVEGANSVDALTRVWLTIDPDTAEAQEIRREVTVELNERGAERELASDWDGALEAYQDALRFDPENQRALDGVRRVEEARVPREPSLRISPEPLQGEPVVLTAVVANGREQATAAKPRFVVLRNGRRLSRRIDATFAGIGSWTATYQFASAGAHTVQFLLVDGEVEAALDVDVQPLRRSARANTRRTVGDDEESTTTTLGASVTRPTPSVVSVPASPQLAAVTAAPTVATPAIAPAPPAQPPILPLAPPRPTLIAEPPPVVQPPVVQPPVVHAPVVQPPPWTSGRR